MLTPSDLRRGAAVVGLEPNIVVTIAATAPAGDAITVFYRLPDGSPRDRLVTPADLASLSLATTERPWSFDGDGEAFQLACEARRIDLAFLFDPMMAVHASNVQPLPHQISAVYEKMLPRQPLRYVLADDPGAGKTIMAGLYIRELIMRADGRRILIVAPGSLVDQWKTELFEKFGLEFQIYSTALDAADPGGNSSRMRGMDSNALASSIVLVCRKRSPTAETISRRQFIRELNATLPQALDAMTRKSEGEHSPVAPVDLSQAIIGPGMAVFSKYAAVLEADGSPMTVRTALQLINRFLAEDDFDADTQFCLHWFEQYGWENGKFGEADTLARAKGTSVEGVKNSGGLQSAGGNVRLLKWADYKPDWDPAADDRLPVWEGLHQLVRVFKTDGESAAGKVLSAVAAKAEPIRQLAYRLYTLCERAGRAEDARAYNELITSWAPIESAAAQVPSTAPAQKTLFE